MTIGRSDDNDLVLADIGVSRRHATVVVDERGARVQDHGSGNGTWCRGQRIDGEMAIRTGDIVLIDPFSLELRRAREAPRYTPRSSSAQQRAQARLDVIRGPSLAQATYLVPVDGLTIGRSEYRDLVILDPAASRHHCDVLLQGGQWRLVDQGSSNGVYLNDARVTDAALEPGDVIRIGNTELRFMRIDDEGPPTPQSTSQGDWTHDLSLPLPEAAAEALLNQEVQSRPTQQLEVPPEPATSPRPPRRGSPWLAVAVGTLGVGLISLPIPLVAGVALVLWAPRQRAAELPPVPPPAPPAWQLEMPAGQAPATVGELFDEGVAAMRERKSSAALRAFYRVLLQEPGNRAAERWSFTAGEHLMLDTLEQRLAERRAQEGTRVAQRDQHLEKWPARGAARVLRRDYRDDPVVLARTGWAPSERERELVRDVDAAIRSANAGAWASAVTGFEAVLDQTRNPALAERARFGRDVARRALAREVVDPWRLGIQAELAGDLDTAREAFRRVLDVDPLNPSARVRQATLGEGPATPDDP